MNLGLESVFRIKQPQIVFGLGMYFYCKCSQKATKSNEHTPIPGVLPTESLVLPVLVHAVGAFPLSLNKYCQGYNLG